MTKGMSSGGGDKWEPWICLFLVFGLPGLILLLLFWRPEGY